MQKTSLPLLRILGCGLLLSTTHLVSAQTLKLSDFAVWGGSTSPAPYNAAQGVFLGNFASVQGNIGSHHRVDIGNSATLAGSIYSGNIVAYQNGVTITGNIVAKRMGTTASPAISGGNNSTITGNLTANGMISLGTGVVTGKAAVPAPSNTNYSGPVPSGGVVTDFTLPVLPSTPNNIDFDNLAGSITISNTQRIAPGRYLKLALTGNRTITFDGPGNYIFNEVDNGNSSNKLVFDFKSPSTGTINIFVIRDASWGTLTVSTVNGNFPARIYTEVHGNGSNPGGNAFNLRGPANIPAGSNLWLGNVWAPNGGISINNTGTSANPHIIGALWSGKAVTMATGLKLVYVAPAVTPSYVNPYYAPPATGKVDLANNVIGAELFALSERPGPITSILVNEIFRFDEDGNVMIEVISKVANDATLQGELVALGMTGIIDNGPAVHVISGFFPIPALLELRNNPRIQYVRPLYPPITNGGQVTTQGDSTMRSNNVRSRFGVDGSGVKIGVISDSYNTKLGAQNDVDQGDLPGPKSSSTLPPNELTIPVQAPNPDLIAGSDEGRAMLQIVHDIAPKATLAFRTGFLTAGDFAKSIQEMSSTDYPGGRCDVIVDDITYITEPFMRDGVVAKTVNEVVGQGVTYISSAGNFGQQSHEAVFSGVTNTSIIPVGQIHKFGATAADIYQTVNLKPGSYTIVLQWNDEFRSLGTSGVQTDMDLYLVGASGFTLFGFNRSNLFGDPFEVCPFTVTEETNAKLMVVRASGSSNVRFKYIIFRGGPTLIDYKIGTSSIVGHPNADSAIAVGAMLYTDIPAITPIWPGVASFSSRGGTFTMQSNNTFGPRQKPDLIAPNGVNTTVNLGSAPFNDGDLYPNFFGTSAAAPHVAAVAGLLIHGRKKYNLQTAVTPFQVRQQLVSSAGRFTYLEGAFSYEGGYGFAQADSAMSQIANARPIISTLEAVEGGAQNGTQPFQVRVRGKYLTPGTQLYFSGKPVPTVVSVDKTEAIATVPAIPAGQDPPFQLYNPPKSPSEIDGGLSEALHFFSAIVDITVRAANKSRKYGQSNPVFTPEVYYNGVLMTNPDTLAKLKLDGNHLTFTTIAEVTTNAGLYGIFPSRAAPLAGDDPLLSHYGFTFVSGTLSIEKMPLRITPNNKTITYGEDLGEVTYTYELDPSAAAAGTQLDLIRGLHKKFLADNALVVLHGFNDPANGLSVADLSNMSMLASFQAVRNGRKFTLQDRRLVPLAGELTAAQIASQRFLVDASAQSLRNYKIDSARAPMVAPFGGAHARAFLNIKALARGDARASLAAAPLQPLVNGQLMAMVNGQLQALVNGQLQAMVNGVFVAAEDIVFQNGQLLALVNGEWVVTTNGQLQAIVNDLPVNVALSVSNGQLQAIVNGQLMALVNGQLQAIVNGQLLAIVNGQLQALVNGKVMPLLNGQLVAMVNGQLEALANGQLLAMVNGQLMALVNGELQIIQDLTLTNDQLQALVNGQLQALVNGQLKAMVNGVVTDIPTGGVALVNGQLQAIVNGQLQAMVNGQLQAMVNGQLQALVNGAAIPVTNVQIINGQLQAMVNGTRIPLVNGQLQAMVNGQLLAMVNGQLMAIVNGELTFAVFANNRVEILVNGQLQAFVNGQLQAMVNGQLQQVNSYSIANGQLQAIVNGVTWAYANGQLLAMVNGQLQALVNNFDVSGTNNNRKTLVLVDQDDINLQGGSIGGMFSINMITGLDVGMQHLVPGGFANENYEVTYGTATVEIKPALLTVRADSVSKIFGDVNPAFPLSWSGFAYTNNPRDVTPPSATSTAGTESAAGHYPIVLSGGSAANYTLLLRNGDLNVKRKVLLVRADDIVRPVGTDNPPLTISYQGLVGDDTRDSVCVPYVIPPTPRALQQLNRLTTYTNVQLNGGSNFLDAAPGQQITLTGNYSSAYSDPSEFCPNCITQIYIGMSNPLGGTVFTDCYDVSFKATYSGNINKTFTAPTIPGVYYITQVSSWEISCYGRGAGSPGNNPGDAIAVVVVNVSQEAITAFTSANSQSSPGTYPITLRACSNYNPNYDVVLQNGTLTVVSNIAAFNAEVAGETAEKSVNLYVDRLYPNPGTSQVRLQVKNDVRQTGDIQVYDDLGKRNVLPVKKMGDRIYDLDVTRLAKGFYHIKVRTSAGVTTFKFVKL